MVAALCREMKALKKFFFGSQNSSEICFLFSYR
jgi:hypothetical protein